MRLLALKYLLTTIVYHPKHNVNIFFTMAKYQTKHSVIRHFIITKLKAALRFILYPSYLKIRVFRRFDFCVHGILKSE